VVHAAESLAHAERPGYRRALDVQHCLNLIQQLHRIARLAVHLVDEGNDGRAAHAAHVEQLDGLRFHTLGRIDHHQRGVHRGQHAVGIFGEILVTGRVEQVNHVVAVFKLHHRAGDRNAALLFNLQKVGGRVAAALAPLYGTCHLNRTRK
jgi:hypothetical protein